ncbi:unannotated protein [freshwater metagenome]|uniref:peptide chain release factor N(5)-glutamine methyltransferase n=1 Tax=freshwater metagenome TaxID=449393 RepID=A0A6J6ILB2_9ZZZZ|nr:peptide chain release factor N(5)-glutamine methyltransferase [Actinomycetota bacterium]
MLISELLEAATEKLFAAGVNSPASDAELLGCFVLGIERSELNMSVFSKKMFPDHLVEEFRTALERREKREPLQHITGVAPFRFLELEVGPGVFVPRPETEQLVDLAIEKIRLVKNPSIIDLCSGSGAIAISLTTELLGSTVYAVELSKVAFDFLKRNYQKYGLDPSNCRNENLAGAFPELEAGLDMVISNPPYIPDTAVPIDLEVQLHDPSIALYGGQDGLDVIRQISTRALYLLKPGGQLVLEHAHTQGPKISELLLTEGWQEVESRQDLAGKVRMICARKP